MSLHDCCYVGPLRASPIPYKLPLSMMKGQIATKQGVLSFLFPLLGPLGMDLLIAFWGSLK